MKKIVFLILISFVFSGCAILKDLQKALNPKDIETYDESLDDVIIKTSDGAFVISSIKLTPDVYGDTLSGVIKNNTKRDYINAKFGIKISDGRYIEHETRISKGARVDFKQPFKYSSGDYDKKTVSIVFLEGKYSIDYDFLMIKPSVNKSLQYADSNLDIGFNISTDNIIFSILNKTQNPIKLDWDSISYVDTESRAHRLIHSNVKLIDSEKQQITTIIPPFANIKENVYPPDYIDRSDSKWKYNPLFPDNSSERLPMIGKTFSFFMPIEINGINKNYNFIFKIAGEK